MEALQIYMEVLCAFRRTTHIINIYLRIMHSEKLFIGQMHLLLPLLFYKIQVYV